MGKKEEIKERMRQLIKEIDKLRYDYHVLNKPGADDEVYTSLRKELQALEEKYPKFKEKASPTERLSGKPLEKFKKITHQFRQWSLNDAESLIQRLETLLLAEPLEPNVREQLLELAGQGSLRDDGHLANVIYALGALPEFQLS